MATNLRLMPVVSAVRAGAACFDMQRTAVYQAIAAGTFPVKCIRAEGRWVVATSSLRHVLDLTADELAEILDCGGDADDGDADDGGEPDDCDD
jgi:hypothetical protein